jgi:hypothetical protein
MRRPMYVNTPFLEIMLEFGVNQMPIFASVV